MVSYLSEIAFAIRICTISRTSSRQIDSLFLAADKISLLVSSMERGRADKESCVDEVVSTSDYDIMDRLKSLGKPDEAYLGGS